MDLFGMTRWSNNELAEVFGISPQRLGVLCKQGIVPLPTDGLHEPKTAVAAYVRHLKQKQEGTSQAGEAVTKMQLENEMRRIKLQRIAGELVPVDRVQKDWFDATRRVRDALLNLPARLSGPFAAETSQEKIYESFAHEVHLVLSELSKDGAGAGHLIEATEPLTFPEPEQTEAPSASSTGAGEPAGAIGDCGLPCAQGDRFSMGD